MMPPIRPVMTVLPAIVVPRPVNPKITGFPLGPLKRKMHWEFFSKEQKTGEIREFAIELDRKKWYIKIEKVKFILSKSKI